MGVPVTVAIGNAYYVFFVPMVIAMCMPMPTVMGMPVTMCTGTSTIGKHASRILLVPGHLEGIDVITICWLIIVIHTVIHDFMIIHTLI